MSALVNGNQGRFNASRSREGETPRKRCCARCRTPYNCGNAECTCHTPVEEVAA